MAMKSNSNLHLHSLTNDEDERWFETDELINRKLISNNSDNKGSLSLRKLLLKCENWLLFSLVPFLNWISLGFWLFVRKDTWRLHLGLWKNNCCDKTTKEANFEKLYFFIYLLFFQFNPYFVKYQNIFSCSPNSRSACLCFLELSPFF